MMGNEQENGGIALCGKSYQQVPHADDDFSFENHSRRGSFGPFRRKPLWVIASQNQLPTMGPTEERENAAGGNNESQNMEIFGEDGRNENNGMNRHLTLFDLISVGVGGTIGSGIFVLCGVIARSYAGPATAFSWAIGGIAAALSGVSYAEMAGRVPSSGSTYVYAFVSMGELPAVIAAACLTLEYGLSGSAVARSWGDKVHTWIRSELDDGTLDETSWLDRFLDPGWGINTMACVISVASLMMLLVGVKESKAVTNFFSMSKILLIAFMAIGGFLLTDRANFRPFVPTQYGVTGIFRGATSSFFGFVGFDEACCLTGEAINPHRNLPRAIMWTILIVTCLSITASLSLTGMQPYDTISSESAFPQAFRYNGIDWAAKFTAAGEIVTLPIVVLISLLAQPRILYVMARDGMLPKVFGEVDSHGNLRKGTLVSGVVMTIVATFVPFESLDDLISSGILLSFNMTNSSVILMRLESPGEKPGHIQRLLVFFNVLCFVSSLLIAQISQDPNSENNDANEGISHHGIIVQLLRFISCAATIMVAFWIAACPKSAVYGGEMGSAHNDGIDYFKVPLMPYLPCLATFVNWYLIAHLDPFGLFLLFFYIGLAVAFYLLYGAKHSVGRKSGWNTFHLADKRESINWSMSLSKLHKNSSET